MKEALNLAWAAGFFDGEGCIRINKARRKEGRTTYNLQIFVRQVDPKPIYKLRDLFGFGAISYRERSVDSNPNARAIYTWSTAGPKAIEVLTALYPFLVTKSEQAEIAFEFQSTINQNGKKLTPEQVEYRESVFQKIKDLKWQVFSNPA